MKNLEKVNPIETPESLKVLEEYRVPVLYSSLKVIEYLLLAAAIASVILLFTLAEKQKLAIYFAAFSASFLFLFLLNKQLWSDFQINLSRSEILTKSEIQSSMLETAEESAKNMIAIARTRALKYCQKLIIDYKKTRRNSRNIYYISQI